MLIRINTMVILIYYIFIELANVKDDDDIQVEDENDKKESKTSKKSK